MTDLQNIEKKIDKIIASGNSRIQTDTLTALLTQVREYARTAGEARALANDVNTLKTQIDKNEQKIKDLRRKSEKSDDEAAKEAFALEQETQFMEQMLLKGEQAQNIWSSQRPVLQKIRGEVENLRSEINKLL